MRVFLKLRDSFLPGWGDPGVPLLPKSLRDLWSHELLPRWVIADAHLAEGSTFEDLDETIWKSMKKCGARLRKFLITIVSRRRFEIAAFRVFTTPWPVGLDPNKVPWHIRTQNALDRSGLLKSEDLLTRATFRDLFAVRGMGAASVLDFACTAEPAITFASTGVQGSLSFPTDDKARRNSDTEVGEARSNEKNSGTEIATRLAEIRDTLSAALQESWTLQVSELDPRFSPLLPAGSGTVFERIEAMLSAPPTAFFEDESALETSISRVRDEIARIEKLPLEKALREYLGALSHEQGARLDAIAARFGWDGNPPVTLEQAASKIKVTRERLRQIQSRIINRRVPSHPVIMPALDRALQTIAKNAPLTPEAAALLLVQKGISRHRFHPVSVLGAASICGRTATFEITTVRGRELVAPPANPLQRIANLVIHTAYIQAGASGVSNVREVAEECGAQSGIPVTEAEVAQVLGSFSDVQFIADDWFWRPTGLPERNRLRNVSRRVLCVSSPINVAVLREGVRREYAWRRTRGSRKWRLIVPPRNVLEAFYRSNPEFAVDENGYVSPEKPLDYQLELSPTEQTLFNVLRSSPTCVLNRADFATACRDRGMNENTFSVYSSFSPIIEHVGTNLWTLRGVHLDPAAVEALREANSSRPRERRIVDYGWTDRGSLWLALRLPPSYQGGVFWIPSDIRRYVEARDYSAYTDDGSPCGTIRVDGEGVSWGYGPFLSRNSADEGDILVGDFDLANGRVVLRLGGDELLEEYSPES